MHLLNLWKLSDFVKMSSKKERDRNSIILFLVDNFVIIGSFCSGNSSSSSSRSLVV